MSLETGSRRAIDSQWIRENESREYNIDYTEDEYTKAVRILAKSKHVEWFPRLLQSYIRQLTDMGYKIDPDKFVADIDRYTRYNDNDNVYDNLKTLFKSMGVDDSKSEAITDESRVDYSNLMTNKEDLSTDTRSYEDVMSDAQRVVDESREQIAMLRSQLTNVFGVGTDDVGGFHR